MCLILLFLSFFTISSRANLLKYLQYTYKIQFSVPPLLSASSKPTLCFAWITAVNSKLVFSCLSCLINLNIIATEIFLRYITSDWNSDAQQGPISLTLVSREKSGKVWGNFILAIILLSQWVLLSNPVPFNIVTSFKYSNNS